MTDDPFAGGRKSRKEQTDRVTKPVSIEYRRYHMNESDVWLMAQYMASPYKVWKKR